jgi:hypothetical protein
MAMTAVRNACLDRLRRQREELVERLPETAADDSRSDVRNISCLTQICPAAK